MTTPSSRSYPPAYLRLAISTSPASGRFRDHLNPRVLCSERVLLSLPSTLLRPDPPVSATPPDFPGSLVIQKVFALRPDMGCRRDLPCFTAVLLPCVPPPLRREEDWVHTRFFPSPKDFPEKSTGRLLHLLQLASCAGVVLSTLQCSLDAAARMVARSPVPVRPEA